MGDFADYGALISKEFFTTRFFPLTLISNPLDFIPQSPKVELISTLSYCDN